MNEKSMNGVKEKDVVLPRPSVNDYVLSVKEDIKKRGIGDAARELVWDLQRENKNQQVLLEAMEILINEKWPTKEARMLQFLLDK